MSVVDRGTRRFSVEFSSLIDKRITVRTTTNRVYTGNLVGYSMSNYSLILSDAEDGDGNKYPRVVVYGHIISEILLMEQPLNMEELAKRLEEMFPKMIKYYPEAKLITVMDRVRVTDKGVEGSGPVAERVKALYERFIQEWKERQEG